MGWAFSELEIEQVDQWPVTAKIMLFIMLSAGLCLAGGYFMVADHWAQWQQGKLQEAELKGIFAQKSQMAASLPAYQQQIEQLQQQQHRLLDQLPSKRDAAKVLHDISELAERNGINLASVRWEKEQQLLLSGESAVKHFPTELSLRIKAQGQYHQLGQFIAHLSALPRIVIIDSLELSRPNGDVLSPQLSMELLANTYTYPTEEVVTTP
ncbi:type IV pilus inner membrane component PilO [Oceanisphaera ostreae]|uniref:Type 4a pilus biogenesis protein PilO n=1 Tax=Oceanisphaera ostreae TaxID=914151 RepID=A0ABW3KKK9_9GAMM